MSFPVADFKGYNPMLKPVSSSAGGGFVVQIEVPESEYENIKELNDPRLKTVALKVSITSENM